MFLSNFLGGLRLVVVDNLILGGGISGVSASYHIGHDTCAILEKESFSLGILESRTIDGYTWDQGPHVSFTKHDYVKNLFAENIDGQYLEHSATPVNYYKGLWIDHPVQSNLYQLPEDVRERCVTSFLEQRSQGNALEPQLNNYHEWCAYSLGEEIASEFIAAYTRKYWTVEPSELVTDWIGPRVHVPNVEDLLAGAKGKTGGKNHYISKIRYPEYGGYQSFVKPLTKDANIFLNHEVVSLDLKNKMVRCENGAVFKYGRLISTIPLPVFVSLVTDIDQSAIEAAQKLRCSELLLVNVEVPVKVKRKEQWLYVYDEDMITSRVTIMDNLAPSNAPEGCSAVQVEIYSSVDKPLPSDANMIARQVVAELYTLGLIDHSCPKESVKFHTRYLKYANVIFDHNRRKALDDIFKALEPLGLRRNARDLDALTDWSEAASNQRGDLCLLGRFGEWKYYWSDDCVMAGKMLAYDAKLEAI